MERNEIIAAVTQLTPFSREQITILLDQVSEKLRRFSNFNLEILVLEICCWATTHGVSLEQAKEEVFKRIDEKGFYIKPRFLFEAGHNLGLAADDLQQAFKNSALEMLETLKKAFNR